MSENSQEQNVQEMVNMLGIPIMMIAMGENDSPEAQAAISMLTAVTMTFLNGDYKAMERISNAYIAESAEQATSVLQDWIDESAENGVSPNSGDVREQVRKMMEKMGYNN